MIEARKLLRKMGDKKLGHPDIRTTTAIEQIDDLARLEELFERLSSVNHWHELLPATPPKREPRRRTP